MQAVFGCLALVIFASKEVHCCQNADWSSSFDNEGFSTCSSNSEAIRGFYRSAFSTPDGIFKLEKAVCCPQSSPYASLANIVIADWRGVLDGSNTWATCPTGFFLTGLYRSDGNEIRNIEEARCMKPTDHPYRYDDCYDEDIGLSFDNEGTSQCQPDYFVTGIYKSTCNNLLCIEKLRCCKMVSVPDVLNSLDRVKTLVMDRTQFPLAILAHYLGYSWSGGCRTPWLGENFRRNEDTWEPDQIGHCQGYRSADRLSMNYADWSFAMNGVCYGKPFTQSLIPETVRSGQVSNYSPTASTRIVTGIEESIRTVKHTPTSPWNNSQELSVIKISYTPRSLPGEAGGYMHYLFTYESSEATRDVENKFQKKMLSVSATKVIQANSSTEVHFVVSKTRTTVAYTVVVGIQFSTELRGFLRWGGGHGSQNTNYHHEHRGSFYYPTLHFTFGDTESPLYEALKSQSDNNQLPWEWEDMKSAHSEAQSFIDRLTSTGQYEFKLSGKFDDIIGERMDVIWGNEPAVQEESTEGQGVGSPVLVDFGNHTSFARALAGDTEAVSSDQIEVCIASPPDVQMPRILQRL